jgi:hypothetical protein
MIRASHMCHTAEFLPDNTTVLAFWAFPGFRAERLAIVSVIRATG